MLVNLYSENKFVLLKRTYPVSKFDRYCDGYKHILENSTKKQRKKWGIIDNELPNVIKKGEKFIYEVGKLDGVFKTMCISTKNFKIIREYFFGLRDI